MVVETLRVQSTLANSLDWEQLKTVIIQWARAMTFKSASWLCWTGWKQTQMHSRLIAWVDYKSQKLKKWTKNFWSCTKQICGSTEIAKRKKNHWKDYMHVRYTTGQRFWTTPVFPVIYWSSSWSSPNGTKVSGELPEVKKRKNNVHYT